MQVLKGTVLKNNTYWLHLKVYIPWIISVRGLP